MKNATRIVCSTFGIVVGIAGFEHGIGEVRQGNIAPSQTSILSWPNSAVFHILGGEPAMTVIPNLLVTGVLAMLVSLLIIVWSAAFIQRKYGGLVLIVLSILELLVGGGYAPPVLGWITGLAATGINAPFTWWRRHLPLNFQSILAKLWPWLYFICLASWLMLLPGTLILGYFFGVDDPGLVISLTSIALGSLVFSILTGYGYDLYQRSRAEPMSIGVKHAPHH